LGAKVRGNESSIIRRVM